MRKLRMSFMALRAQLYLISTKKESEIRPVGAMTGGAPALF
jgi:hypothetical protein